MKNFKQLLIWQKGMKIVFEVYKVSKQLPKEEQFGLVSQINRAAVSIPSNIAEGSSRKSDRDYCRFLEIALGSIFELETQLLIIKELKILLENELDELFVNLREETKMIHSFINKLS